jgi:argininosuccinate lyase
MSQSKRIEHHKKGPGVDSRLSESPAAELIEFGYKVELREAGHVFPHELWNHKAHSIMLYEQGILARRHVAKILTGLRQIEAMGFERFPMDPRKGELYYNIESFLLEKIGEDAGGRMHSGRSRGDMYVCSERMILREKILQVVENTLALIETILALAARHVETLMPGYTLLQHAQPTTLAHYLLSFADRFQRDLKRLQETYQRVNLSPMGAAIGTGSSFPLNRSRMARLLGFRGVIENTRDASISRDFTLESATHAAILASDLSTLADDLNVWCTYEFGMIELSDAYCSTSTIMPQKKNPSSLERMRYLSAECIGSAMTVFAQLKTYSEELGDLEATGPVACHILDNVRAVLLFMRGVLSTLTVKKDVMRERAGANFTQATQLAETIAQGKGLAFRTAHRIVGKLVRRCLEEKVSPAEVTPEMLDRAAVEIQGRPLKLKAETIRKAMDAAYIIEHRNTPGSPGRRQVTSMLRKRSLRMAREQRWLAGEREYLDAARELVESLVRKLTKG